MRTRKQQLAVIRGLASALHVAGGDVIDMDDDPDVAAIVCLLAKYLLANPLACDTADGIRRWWLPAGQVPIDAVLTTLAWMKRQTLIEETIAADGRMRYRRCATDADIEAVVERFCRNARMRH